MPAVRGEKGRGKVKKGGRSMKKGTSSKGKEGLFLEKGNFGMVQGEEEQKREGGESLSSSGKGEEEKEKSKVDERYTAAFALQREKIGRETVR